MTSSRTIGRAAAVAILVVLGLLGAQPVHAQGARFALLVQGASGGPPYSDQHRGWLDRLAGLLRDDFGYDEDHLVVLAEQAQAGEVRATADNLRTSLDGLMRAMGDDDQPIVVLIGHGSAQGGEAKFNLVGPDLSADEWKAALAPVPGRLAVVNTTSASFPFVGALSAPGRVVMAATNTAAQRYHTHFPEAFISAFGDDQSDLDKDGRVSLLEAFTYASRAVAAHFEQSATMATENAVLDDNGDGEGRLATAEGDDGAIARVTYFGGVAVATSDDPEMQGLLAAQQDLTGQMDALRAREALTPPDEFAAEFERLALELARVSAEIRQRQGQ